MRSRGRRDDDRDPDEGSPVGIYLASLIARDGGDDDVIVSGDDRYVADYLQRESFDRLPERRGCSCAGRPCSSAP